MGLKYLEEVGELRIPYETQTMQTRPLGKTGLNLPILSFGISSLGQETRDRYQRSDPHRTSRARLRYELH